MEVGTLLADVLQRPLPELGAGMALKDIPGWDSVVMVRLFLRIEERKGRELSEAEIEAISTVGDVARMIG